MSKEALLKDLGKRISQSGAVGTARTIGRRGLRKLLIGGTLVAGGAAGAGAVTAAKEESKRSLAPDTALPPGY